MADVLRRTLFIVFAVLVYGAAGAWLSSVVPAGAQNQPTELDAQAHQAIDSFFGAIISGDPAKVAAVLAPDFQILRSDGSNYDAASYPTSDLPIIAEMPAIERLKVTSDGDTMVASYVVDVNETLGGQVVQSVAPRLTVFRKSGDAWLVVAHGNFAVIEQ
jgi:ketosteroid isomerase-like protein